MNKYIPAVIAIQLSLSCAQAFVEFDTNFDDDTTGERPMIIAPTAGSIANKPTEVIEDENVTVRVEELDGLKGKSLVIEDNAVVESGGLGAIVFGQGLKDNAVGDGKLFIHFNWMLMKNDGNVFVDLQNAERGRLLNVQIGKDGTVQVTGETISKTTTAPPLPGTPGIVEIIIDFSSADYVISFDHQQIAEGKINRTENPSFYSLIFSTASTGTATFAINNVTISQTQNK